MDEAITMILTRTGIIIYSTHSLAQGKTRVYAVYMCRGTKLVFSYYIRIIDQTLFLDFFLMKKAWRCGTTAIELERA